MTSMPDQHFRCFTPPTKFGMRRAMLMLAAGLVAGGCSSSGGSGSGFGVARSEIALGGGSDSVQLSWDAPDHDMSGAPVKSEQGFRLYHRNVPGEFEAVTLGPVNGVLVHGLDSGSHEFAVTTLSSDGAESAPSKAVQITLP